MYMDTAPVQGNQRLVEAREAAKEAALSTRGMYPITKASNVFKTDGEPIEPPTDEEPDEEDPKE